MNNLQRIVKDNTRVAMHMAVELCEQGDFDSVSEAFRWLEQETSGTHTRWYELFGTPERAAQVMIDMCSLADSCPGCPFYSSMPDGICGDYYALLEWLKGDA